MFWLLFTGFIRRNRKDWGRLAKLLLLLSPVKNIAADLLEELFFPGMVGSVKIDSVIPYILTMGEGWGGEGVRDDKRRSGRNIVFNNNFHYPDKFNMQMTIKT